MSVGAFKLGEEEENQRSWAVMKTQLGLPLPLGYTFLHEGLDRV